jgi:hypothetical protein
MAVALVESGVERVEVFAVQTLLYQPQTLTKFTNSKRCPKTLDT